MICLSFIVYCLLHPIFETLQYLPLYKILQLKPMTVWKHGVLHRCFYADNVAMNQEAPVGTALKAC